MRTMPREGGFAFFVGGKRERVRTIVMVVAVLAVLAALVGIGIGLGAAITSAPHDDGDRGANAVAPGFVALGSGHGAERIGVFPSRDGTGPGGGGAGPGGTAQPSPAPPPPSGQGARTPLPPSPPTRVWIPSIGVTSSLIRLGMAADGSLEVPSDYGIAGWWAGGPTPGETGAAVIVGHVDSKSGPGVFFRLRRLKPGDVVWVARQDGTRVRFLVQRLVQAPKTRFPTREVYASPGYVALRLITCGGAFDRRTGHYVDNVIVFARASG